MQAPCITECDDGSILIEWISRNKRFGISIEKDLKESGWFFVSSSPDFRMECETFPEEMIEYLKKYFK